MPDHILKSSALTKPTDFALSPSSEERGTMAADLGILGIRKLTFAGTISPVGREDLVLSATLGASVVQTCIVTSEPVTTRIEEDISRRYLAEFTLPEGDEVEMPEDDTAEELPAEIDLSAVMAEALALALPPWPRIDGADPVDLTVTEPGIAPMTDEDAKPFAGLKNLRDKMKNSDKEG